MRSYPDADHDRAAPSRSESEVGQAGPRPAGSAPIGAAPLRDHPLRHVLNNELHARPFTAVVPPERVSHLALLTGEEGAAEDHDHLARLCERYGVPPPRPGVSHFSQDLGACRVKWERHTEFVTYTFFRHGDFDEPFRSPVLELVARDWLDQLPGQVLSAAHVAILPRAAPEPEPQELARHFIAETLGGSLVAGGGAAAYTDFQVHADGFARVLVRDRGLVERQGGRLVQRLLEKQTYRMMALLALPVAREIVPELTRCERELAEVALGMTGTDVAHEQRALLDRLARIAAAIERLSAATSYRFRASRAYYGIVQDRIEELREERIEGLQTFGEFMDRRLQPAMRTCEATAERLDSVSQRVTRAGELLQARVGITVQEQNRDVLQSMDARARVQLIIQEMVEGLSVVAIAYYTLGLLGYLLGALAVVGSGFDRDVVAAAATPVVVVLVWLILRRLRKRRLSEART